jgi:hypothetical protein
MGALFGSRLSSKSFPHGRRAAWWLAALLAMCWCVPASGQQSAQTVPEAPAPLITQAIDESQLTVLTGNTHPWARPQFDLGIAPATLPMERMLLVLKRSNAQEVALRKLLDDQQDKNSPNYHRWMTPEQFGAQFGPSDADMRTIKSWLEAHGFQVGTTKGRTVLEFSGSASQAHEAFHTTIHKYIVNGEQYWANASDPSIPTALLPAVAGIASLNNFPRKAMNVPLGTMKQDKATGKLVAVKPLVTEPGGCTPANECYGLGPYDFATIYNLTPLWNSGIDGTGVTIAISGETDIQMSDVETFRSVFGLPSNNPVFVYNGPDPGIQGDESEADIDVQWSGGVAKGATIDFVISESTETTSGVDLSAVYIVDQNLAPIMSESYGECELALGTTGNQFYNALWQQASAEGITVFISAGDAGSAGCDNFDAEPPAPAQYGLQVSGYASTPYNVAVGGTDFNDFTDSASYWGLNNDSFRTNAGQLRGRILAAFVANRQRLLLQRWQARFARHFSVCQQWICWGSVLDLPERPGIHLSGCRHRRIRGIRRIRGHIGVFAGVCRNHGADQSEDRLPARECELRLLQTGRKERSQLHFQCERSLELHL